jgi:hypothetical protein
MRSRAIWGASHVLLAVAVAFVVTGTSRQPTSAAGAAPPPARRRAPALRRRVVSELANRASVESDATPARTDGDLDQAEIPVPAGGILTGRQLWTQDPVTQQQIKRGVRQAVTRKVFSCVGELPRRIDVEGAEEIEFEVKFRASSEGDEKTRLSEVDVLGEWPALLDEKARSCILDAYRGVELETGDPFAFSHELSYPTRILLNHAPGAADED